MNSKQIRTLCAYAALACYGLAVFIFGVAITAWVIS